MVINDCWLLYLNVSPQLPGTALIGSRTCRWPQLILRPPNSPACLAVRGPMASVTPLLAYLCWPLKGEREGIFPIAPFPHQLLLCLFKGEGKKKDQNRPKKPKKNLGMREGCVEERKIYFILWPATAPSSAALAEIASCVLAFSLLLYCRRVIRIIYCLAARLSLSVENASLIFFVCLYNIYTCAYVMQGAVRKSLHAIAINFYD